MSSRRSPGWSPAAGSDELDDDHQRRAIRIREQVALGDEGRTVEEAEASPLRGRDDGRVCERGGGAHHRGASSGRGPRVSLVRVTAASLDAVSPQGKHVKVTDHAVGADRTKTMSTRGAKFTG